MAAPDRTLKILHVPVDLGGHPRALAREQRRLGHDAISITLLHSELGFNGDECFDAPIGTRGRLVRRELARLTLLRRALTWADVVHCHFGQTIASIRPLPVRDPGRAGLAEAVVVAYARLAWLRDLALLRAAGKRIAMTFYGDDVRLVGLSLTRNPYTHLQLPELRSVLEVRDAFKRELVNVLSRAGVIMFATNPDLLAALPPTATFLPYGNTDPDAHEVALPRAEGTLKLVHMPTHRGVKGTELFVAAIDHLRRQGHDVELSLIEHMSNAEALGELGSRDVLLDQLRVGWYGGVAVEAMAMGKPVVVYLHPEDVALVPAAMRQDLPFIGANPDSVGEALTSLVAMPRRQLMEIGLASRRFVERWHRPADVARTVLDHYG